MIVFNQSISTMQNYVRWTLIALSSVLKLKIFLKTLQMMLKKDLIHQILKSISHFKKQKSDWINKRKNRIKNHDKICRA